VTSSHLTVFPTSLTPRTFNRQDCLPLWPETLWKIDRGIVRTITWTAEGRIISLGYWGPGDVIGQPLSRLDPYQMECRTSVAVSLIPPTLWPAQLDSILAHIQDAQELHSIVQSTGTEQRLLNFLMWLGKKFGHSTEVGKLIDLRLTHLEIADVIGTTRVSVTRMMQRLEHQGYISRPRRHYVVLLN
jgi:CRP-like cAMP-binding protein